MCVVWGVQMKDECDGGLPRAMCGEITKGPNVNPSQVLEWQPTQGGQARTWEDSDPQEEGRGGLRVQ